MSETNKLIRHDPPAAGASGGVVPLAAGNPPMARLKQAARPAVQAEAGLTPRFVLNALRRWWLIATPLALLLATIAGAVVYLLFEPVYEAAAWFKIEERAPYWPLNRRTTAARSSSSRRKSRPSAVLWCSAR